MEDKDKQDESNDINDIKDAIKKKIGSGYLFFVAISFVGLNWKDLLLIAKSKCPIENILPKLFQAEVVFGEHIESWVFHFLFPVILGVFFSIISSYLNLIVVLSTTYANEYASRVRDIVIFKLDIRTLDLANERDEKKESINKIKAERERLIKECDKSRDMIGKSDSILDGIFNDIQSIINFYEKNGGIKSADELNEFISALNKSKYANDESISNSMKKMVADLKKIQQSY